MASGGGKSDNFGTDDPKPLGLKAERLPSQEFGRVVPYFAGYGMMSGIFISEAWGVRSVAVKKKVGKKSQTVGYNYYCSFAMLFCLGPVDRIEQIWLNDELFWEGAVSRGATDYADITVTPFGTLRLYWGTETQDQDADLNASGVLHPAYRGQCYAVFKDWLLGMNKTQVPAIEIRIQRTPAVPWITAAQNLDDDANPVACLAEWWEHPRYGLGLSNTRLDKDRLNAVADRLVSEGLGVSPFVTNGARFPKLLATLMDHIDAYPAAQADGLFAIDLVRPIGYVPREINEADLMDVPQVTSNLWWDTFNEVHVKFENRERYFETDAVSHRDMAAYAIVGSTRDRTVQRPWITKQGVAIMVAAALGRQSALPFMEAKIKVRRDAAVGLNVGSVIRLSYANSGISLLPMRVDALSIRKPDSPDVDLELIEDRGYLNAEFYLPAEETPLGEVRYQPLGLFAQGAVELPFGWEATDAMRFGMQPTRNDVVSNGFVVWWERITGSYVDVADSDVFWMTGTLNAAFPESIPLESHEDLLDVTFGGTDKTLDPVTYEEAVQSPWVFLFIGDEILIPYEATLVSAGRYSMKVLRARYGTLRETHAGGATARVLTVYTSPMAEHDLAAPTLTPQNYKLQPFFLATSVALADCPVLTVTPRKRGLAPLPPSNLKANGDGYNPTYGAGGSAVMTWTQTHELRDQRPPEEVLVPRAQSTVLEILTTADVLKATVTVAGTAGPYTITNGAIVAALGSEVSFKVRAYYLNAAVRSLTFSEITVWKV